MTSYLEELQQSIASQKQLLELLIQRKDLLQSYTSITIDEYGGITALQNNQAKIDLIKIESEIYTVRKVINEKEKYFENYAKEFDAKREEALEKYSHVRSLAIARSKSNPEIKQFLDSVDYNLIESGIEYKVNFYYKLKSMLNGK